MCTALEPRASPQTPLRGMTLLEVVVGLAILGLLAGAVFAIVSGSVESSAMLALTQTEDRRVEAFLDRTRTALAHLPAGASLELKVLGSDPLRQEFVLRGIPEAFVWGANPRWDKAVVTLCPQPWEPDRKGPTALGGPAAALPSSPDRYALRLHVPDFFRTTDDGEPVPESPVRSRQGNQYLKPDQEGRFWVDLLPEVERVEWRFYDAARKLWLEQHAPGRPPLVELRLLLAGRTTPLRAVFSTD